MRESALGDAILDMLERRSSYSPRQWVLDHMTCQQATAIVEAHVRAAAAEHGEPWTSGIAVRTSTLDTQRYWDEADRDRFADDYRFLEASEQRA